MPMTAKGSGGAQRRQRSLEARFRQHGELALGRLQPRVAEQVAGRDPEQLASLEAAQPFASLLVVAAPFEGVERVGDQLGARRLAARASSSSRASTNSGWRRSASPITRLDPSRWHVRSAAPGASRNVTASDADRAGPSTSRRSCSSPRSGSGVSDSHSRMTGSSSCMTRDRRVRPAASSRTAARVRSTSVKPKAARRSSAASGDRGPVPARVSSSGAKKRRSWMLRTARWCSRCSASNRSRAVRSGLSR